MEQTTIPQVTKQNELENGNLEIITDIEFQDVGQVSRLREITNMIIILLIKGSNQKRDTTQMKIKEYRIMQNLLENQNLFKTLIIKESPQQNSKIQKVIMQILLSQYFQRKEIMCQLSMNKQMLTQQMTQFSFFQQKDAQKIKPQKVFQETGHSFYGPYQQNQVQQKISSIKDSIASAYLQSESSLSPFIQVYLKQALKIQNNPKKKISTSRSINKNYSYESTNSLRENNYNTEGDYVEEFQPKKHNFLAETNNLMDQEMIESDKNNINQQLNQNQKNISPNKNKSIYIKDKLERMHSISGDYLIGSGLQTVKNNILNALTQEQETQPTDGQEIVEELNSSQDRHRGNTKRKYQKYHSRIKTVTDEDFYSNFPNNPSFYDDQNKEISTRQYSESNNFKTEISEGQSKRQNTYWSVNIPDQQKKSISHNGKEYQRNKSKETEITIQGISQEQSSKTSKPQKSQSQGPKSGQAFQCLFYNADPNNNMLKDFFGQVDNINLNNIFVNQLGLTEDQKKQMFDKMDSETRQKIQQKFIVQDKISKYTKYSNNQFDEFQQSFKNNFQFIDDESKKSSDPLSQMHIKSAQKSTEYPNVHQTENKRSISIQKKRVSYTNQADPETIQRFQTPINLSKLVTYSRIKTDADVLTDIGSFKQSKGKKEYPLYINRVNRVRLQSFSSSKQKQEKRKEAFSSDNKNSIDENNQSRNNIRNSQFINSFIDPRKVYRQNLEIYQNQNSSIDKNKLSESMINVTQIKTINQSEGFQSKVFFQNQDLKKKLQISNLKINL